MKPDHFEPGDGEEDATMIADRDEVRGMTTPATDRDALADPLADALYGLAPLVMRHKPVGAYLPVGQLEGDCSCGRGPWPCDEVAAALAPVVANLIEREKAQVIAEAMTPIDRMLDWQGWTDDLWEAVGAEVEKWITPEYREARRIAREGADHDH